MNTAFSGSITRDPVFPQPHHAHKANHQASRLKGNDEQAIGLLTPEKTQAILNRQIADKLAQRFKEEGIELKGLQAEDFTPEKVSERILGFVTPRILAGEDKEQQTELMAQARKGIEQGFAEARDILDSLDVLNGKVKEDVDSTYDLIQQGLERLQQQLDGTLVNDDSKDDDTSVTSLQQATMASSFSRNENTRVEITTTDGDTVLIDLFKQQSAESTRSYSQSEEGVSYSASRTLSASTGISYQVQGELDEEEQQAIDELLKEVAKVSDSFFSGNVQKAFKTALAMDFDSEELTRFSLNLDYQETRQVAISTYSEYQSQSRNEDGEHPVAPAGLKDMSDFIKQMDHLFENPFALNKMAQPEQGIGDLFKGMNQLLHGDEMKKLEQESASLLDSLVNQLKQFHNNELNASASQDQEAIA